MPISISLLIFNSHDSFPNYISDALLRCDFTADSQQLTRLVSTVDQNRERIRDILHRDSLRLLAYVLLNSDNVIEQQSGLHLLLVRSHDFPLLGRLSLTSPGWTDPSQPGAPIFQ